MQHMRKKKMVCKPKAVYRIPDTKHTTTDNHLQRNAMQIML